MADFLTRLSEPGSSARTRVLSVGVVVVALAVIWSMARWATSPDWVPLGNQLPVETVGAVTQTLDEAGIVYKLELAGTRVSVSAEDLPRARVLLAGAGLPEAGSPGWELFDQPSWGMTDFTQRVNYRRALEGELERTLKAMDGVGDAQVHLSLSEKSFLRRRADTEPSRASVVLTLRGGNRPQAQMVEGVGFLVASSVEGIEADQVTVMDQVGRVLSSPQDEDGSARSDRQLAVRRDTEEYLELKAEELVGRVFGPGNVSVRVAADLNFDELDRTVQAVDPEDQLLTREDRAEINPQTEEQGAASVTVNAEFETTRSVETFSRSGARVDRLTVAVVLNQRRVVDGDGNVTYQPRSADELRQVESLVRNAVGVTDQRGDAISVVSVPFDMPDVPEPVAESTDVLTLAQTFQKPAVALMAIIMASVLALKLLGAIKTAPASSQRASLPRSGEEQGVSAAVGEGPGADGVSMKRAGPQIETPELGINDPKMTARVLQAWMKDG
jgi:flagellar M-ring protein FliF